MKNKDDFDDFIFDKTDFLRDDEEFSDEDEYLDEEDLERSYADEFEDDSDEDYFEDMEFVDADEYGEFGYNYSDDDEIPDFDEDYDLESEYRKSKMKRRIGWTIVAVIVAFLLWMVATNSGRSFALGFVAKFIHSNIGTESINEDDISIIVIPEDELSDANKIDTNEDGVVDASDDPSMHFIVPRSEDYVTTYLLFGLEQIDGAANTDAIMLVSINTKDNTIKLTSILRDTYVQIPGWDKNKINSAYAKGAHGAVTGAEARKNGAELLMTTIEQTFDVEISGYACVNFSSFEKVIDRLGGIDIELGEAEAEYLNKTNYISEEYNRNVVPGWNHLNGNQAMGYVRVRKVETLGGANNDFGRTTRQRRVISAIVSKYKSSGIFDILSITKDCLAYISTDVSEEQIQKALTDVVNNGIFTIKSLRIPVEECYYDSGKKGINNGSKNITYAIVIDDYIDENRKQLHKFLFLDEEDTQ